MRRNLTGYQTHHLFKHSVFNTTKLMLDKQPTGTKSEIDYYALFLALGWITIINGNRPLTHHENLPIAAIGHYANHWRRKCDQLLLSNPDAKIKKAAKHLLIVINTHPEKILKIMNEVTLEYCRREFSKRYEKPIVELTIGYLATLITDRHSLITSNDISSSKPLLDTQTEVFALIQQHSLKQSDLLKKNAIFFISHLFPTKQLLIPLTLLIPSLDMLSTNKLQRFFHYANIKKQHKKIVAILNAPYWCTDKTQFSSALKAAIRMAQLPTYSWINKPSTHHAETRMMQYMRETRLLNEMVFVNYQAGFWKCSDLPPTFVTPHSPSDQVLPIKVPRAIGLAINEKNLYELRRLGGIELFLQHLNEDNIHCMYFNAISFSEALVSMLNPFQKMGEWKQKETEQHIRIYASPYPLSKEARTLLSVGVLIKSSLTQLLTEVLALCDMKAHEQIDLLLLILRNEFANQQTEYLIMYPPLLAAHQSPKPVTAVICAGANVWFGIYKGMIARLLMNGLNVMAFSYRGHELSEGTPNDHKLCQDLEIVCHYLIEDKRLSNEQIILYASCTGLAPSAQYVYHHPQTNLIIDRSFSRGSTMIKALIQDKNVFQLSNGIIKKLTAQTMSTVIPYFINYENLTYLENTNSEIALITSDKDEILGEQALSLKKGLPRAHHITSPAMFGHGGNLLRDKKMIDKLEGYLGEKHFARRMGI